jgi:omega-6 fatty acid desaturase (delta-12 desaturase)
MEQLAPPLPSTTAPVRDAAGFAARTRGITTADLIKAIPPECFRLRPGRAWTGVITSTVVGITIYAALAFNPFWWLLPVLWFLAGTNAWGCYVIGHDCGHGSFSSSRRLNHFVGHLMLTPLLYPFHSWRLLHNHHHANTNSLENDIDWRPLPAAVYRRLPALQRYMYRLIRTLFWWAGTIHQWATRAFDLDQYPTEEQKRQVRFSIAMVALFAAVFFPLLVYWAGPWGVVKYWLMPWLVAHGWFSLTTLTHHTHPDIPYLDKRNWSFVTANLTSTVHCRYPRWLEFLEHDINAHIPHHIAPRIPFYHLRQAHESLRQTWPELVREVPFGWRYLWQLTTTCNLYDDKTGYYLPFSAVAIRKQRRPETARAGRAGQ